MATISIEEDAPPIVRILGVTLRRASRSAALADTLDHMHGRVALQSSSDPQAATITFDKGRVSLRHGVDPASDVVITIDLATMGRPNAPKPKVKGAVSHPKLALAAAKVLDPPVVDSWRGAAREFWAWAEPRPTRPPAMRVVCTDPPPEGGELVLGDPDPDLARGRFELQAPAWVLVGVLTGGDHLGQAALEGRVRVVGDLATFNRMIGLLTDVMLGAE